MLELILAAYGIGIVGSFHCVGMCGPLALSLPLNNQNTNAKIWGALLYNIGRVVTYSFFGFIFGLIGKTFSFFGFQQWLSISLGTAIIIYMLFGKRMRNYISYPTQVTKFFSHLRSALAKLYKNQNLSSLFAIGLLNGLLPCGLVYIAAAGAVSTGNVMHSIIFMSAFGMGTLPAMWSIAFFGNYIARRGRKLRQRIKNVYPYIMVCMAGLLIIRGLGFGIPYLSPKVNSQTNTIEQCHDKGEDIYCKGK
ncbi:MAG: sulfite exporter TauE/SafE family protein [Bacteroidota bacterium]|nr:sulfite exporter TauE/SafE family protein [Bacteroidota bacterium]